MIRFTGFATNYEVRSDQELPGTGGDVAIFRRGDSAPSHGGCDGPLLRVLPATGSSWLGCYARGYRAEGVVDALFATPNPDVVCVVSQGAGYWVDTLSREKVDVPAFPIRQVELDESMMLFADFTRLAAFNSTGLLWVSAALVSDRLVIKRINKERAFVVCQGWSAPKGTDVEILVDLHTGLLK